MSNIRNNNPISDKEILNNVAKAVNRSITMLADELEEKKGTLYQITTGRNHISTRIKAKILETFPNVSPDYIETGIGDVIRKHPSEQNDIFKEEIFMQLARLDKKVDVLTSKLSTLIIALSKK